MRFASRLRLFAIAMLLAVAGCASTRSDNPAPVAIAAPSGPAALDLCPDPAAQSPSVAPAALADRPGYTQLAVSVTDASGKPIPGVRQSHFRVDILGQNLPILYFAGVAQDAPISLVIVMDDSGSMHGKLVVDPDAVPVARKRILTVTETLNRCDEVAIVMASGARANGDRSEVNKVRVVQPFTTDHALAVHNIYEYVPEGETSLYDAIALGLTTISGAHYRNRALLVITDGIDNTSTTKEDQLIAKLRRSDIRFFVIGIGDPSAQTNSPELSIGPFVMGGTDLARMDAKNLSGLATAANGRFYEASAVGKDQGESFAQALQKVSDSLGGSYVIGVVVPPRVEAPRALPRVTVSNQPGATVATRLVPSS
ncbi:MAG: VWA domain-containing protein [Candidatus Binataceae bacterium]